VWQALTDADLTARYRRHRDESDWREGSTCEHVRTDGSDIADIVGTVLDVRRPERLVVTFPGSDEDIPSEADLQALSAGRSAVLANLKSLLETGDVLPQAPWGRTPNCGRRRWPQRRLRALLERSVRNGAAAYPGGVFLLFGFGSKQQDLGPGQVRSCPRCGDTSQWQQVRQFRQFTVFFVPILRWRRQRFEVCGICGNAVEA